jgi:hypothetical protein
MFAQPHLFSKSWPDQSLQHRLPKFLTSATRVAHTAVAVVATVADSAAATVMVVAAVHVAQEATLVETARVDGLIAHLTQSALVRAAHQMPKAYKP